MTTVDPCWLPLRTMLVTVLLIALSATSAIAVPKGMRYRLSGAVQYIALGKSYAKKGDTEGHDRAMYKAIDQLTTILSVDQSDPEVWRNYGIAHAELGHFAIADTALSRATLGGSTRAESDRAQFAELLLAEAVRNYQEASKDSPSVRPEDWPTVNRSLELIETAYRMKPQAALVRCHYVTILRFANRLDDARTLAKESAAAFPGDQCFIQHVAELASADSTGRGAD